MSDVAHFPPSTEGAKIGTLLEAFRTAKMSPNDYNTTSDRVLSSHSSDRAIHFDPVHEPLNRRARRYLAREMRRSERREDRKQIREEIAKRASR